MLAEHGGRTVRIRALPIGIPFSTFETMAQAAPPKALSLGDIKIILGIDRLDYTKGKIKLWHISIFRIKLFSENFSYLNM